MIYFTEIEGVPVFDAFGEYVGKVVEICIDPEDVRHRVAFYIARSIDGRLVSIPYVQIQSLSVQSIHTNTPAAEIPAYTPNEDWIRVKKDLLDQQIIDVTDRKVVRVNDVDFDIQPVNGHTQLLVIAVNVGLAAAARRLLKGLLSKHLIRRVENFLPQQVIPWDFVNLIEADPSRRLKLRISYDRLARMHPADLGDILEHLSAQDQTAVLTSIDEETAAEALSEIPTSMQASIVKGMEPHKAADLIEEMPPDEAADLLQELPPETSTELLAGMEPEEAEDVQELLQFEEDVAGALMTTDFIALPENATAEDAVTAVGAFEGSLESLHVLYLIDADEKLVGAIPLAQVVARPASKPLRELFEEPLISTAAEQPHDHVIELFQKYNLVSLPVVDEQGKLIGEVTSDDVIDLIVRER